MGFFKLGTMTLKSVFTKPQTLKYPFVQKDPYEQQKGCVVNSKPKDCTLCGICQKKCPCSAILVDREKGKWEINYFSCIQCGYCIDSCPKKCLSMQGKRPEISTVKNNFIVSIPKQVKKSDQ